MDDGTALEHCRAVGLDAVPQPIGLDEDGREVLEFLPGTVPGYPISIHTGLPSPPAEPP